MREQFQENVCRYTPVVKNIAIKYLNNTLHFLFCHLLDRHITWKRNLLTLDYTSTVCSLCESEIKPVAKLRPNYNVFFVYKCRYHKKEIRNNPADKQLCIIVDILFRRCMPIIETVLAEVRINVHDFPQRDNFNRIVFASLVYENPMLLKQYAPSECIFKSSPL